MQIYIYIYMYFPYTYIWQLGIYVYEILKNYPNKCDNDTEYILPWLYRLL